MKAAQRLRFSKMQGAGNDFVILDRRGLDRRAMNGRGLDPDEVLDPALAVRLADRHFGVGCDQVITIEAPRSAEALAYYGIWNADGSPSQQCGNGARCVAAWLGRDGATSGSRFRLDSPSGPVEAELREGGTVAIRMGVPDFAPAAIGLRDASAADLYRLDVASESIYFGAVSMGNPHAVLEVNDIDAADVARVGPMLQQHRFFSLGCNVGFAQILASDHIRLRVNERGVGETLACGSGACAAVAVLARRGRVGPEVAVELRGGTLQIYWAGAGHPVWMAGPAEFVFEGEFIA